MDSRTGAIMALGKIADDGSAATLGSLLTDPSAKIRYFAAWSLKSLSQRAKMTQLNTILSAAATTAAPLIPMSDARRHWPNPLTFKISQLRQNF